MLIKRLEVFHYRTQWEHEEHVIADPTWQQIEEAIRRLDRFHYPWVWLRLTEEIDNNYMTVMGGEGAYWPAISAGGFMQRRLLYPEQGTDEVEVWTSDQGFGDEKRHICFNLDAVLHAAKFFAETGGFDPSLPWEPKRG